MSTRQDRQRNQKQEGRIAVLEVDLAEKPSKQPQNLNQIHSFSLFTLHHYNYSYSRCSVVPIPQFPANSHPLITHNLSRLSRRAAIASIVPCVPPHPLKSLVWQVNWRKWLFAVRSLFAVIIANWGFPSRPFFPSNRESLNTSNTNSPCHFSAHDIGHCGDRRE